MRPPLLPPPLQGVAFAGKSEDFFIERCLGKAFPRLVSSDTELIVKPGWYWILQHILSGLDRLVPEEEGKVLFPLRRIARDLYDHRLSIEGSAQSPLLRAYGMYARIRSEATCEHCGVPGRTYHAARSPLFALVLCDVCFLLQGEGLEAVEEES